MAEEPSSRKPSYYAYTIRNYDKGGEKEAVWTKIGAAWLHRDGKGFRVRLEALPIDGTIELREPKSTSTEEPAPMAEE